MSEIDGPRLVVGTERRPSTNHFSPSNLPRVSAALVAERHMCSQCSNERGAFCGPWGFLVMNNRIGRLDDGTQYLRYRDCDPLDASWLSALDAPSALLMSRWLARRAELIACGRFDGVIARLIEDWNSSGSIPRPIETEGRSHRMVLLELAFDAAVAASVDDAETAAESVAGFPDVAHRREAAEILSAVIDDDRDLAPSEVARLHALICVDPTPKLLNGEPHVGFARSPSGQFRAKPVYVVGTDRIMKEGCPARQVPGAIYRLTKAAGDARRAGVSGPVRGAWKLFALSVVHPFYDGNGRVARMLASFSLVRDGGLPLLIPPQLHTLYMDSFSPARKGHPSMLVRLVAECQNAALTAALRYAED